MLKTTQKLQFNTLNSNKLLSSASIVRLKIQEDTCRFYQQFFLLLPQKSENSNLKKSPTYENYVSDQFTLLHIWMNREAITYVRISKRLDESILNVDKDSMFDFEKTQRMADRLTSIFTNSFRSNSNFYSTSILLHFTFWI